MAQCAASAPVIVIRTDAVRVVVTLAGARKHAICFAYDDIAGSRNSGRRKLPAERQDMAGKLLLTLAASAPQYQLTAEQIEDLKLAIAQADSVEFATDQEIAETWK